MRAYPPNPVITQPAGILMLGSAEDIAPDYTGDMAYINDASVRLITAGWLDLVLYSNDYHNGNFLIK